MNMNAATRILDLQENLIAQVTFNFFQIARSGMGIGIMIFLLLTSAFSIIYSKDLERRLFIQYQEVQQQRESSLVEWNKLLLEQSTWSAQLRIQNIANNELGMVTPRSNDITMVAVE